MHLIAWNCRRGPYERKVAALDALVPDVAVVTECAAPRAPDTPQRVWIQDIAPLGITVLARLPYALEPLPRVPGPPRLVAPLRVSGPVCFTLLAVWTWPEPTYHTPLHAAVEAYDGLFRSGPVVVAGDFNSSAYWTKPVRGMSHATVDAALRERGLVSAYHAATGETPGRETRPTHYHLNRTDRPFHIDYCYVPASWARSIASVTVGGYEEWRPLSDHRPVTVDLALGGPGDYRDGG